MPPRVPVVEVPVVVHPPADASAHDCRPSSRCCFLFPFRPPRLLLGARCGDGSSASTDTPRSLASFSRTASRIHAPRGWPPDSCPMRSSTRGDSLTPTGGPTLSAAAGPPRPPRLAARQLPDEVQSPRGQSHADRRPPLVVRGGPAQPRRFPRRGPPRRPVCRMGGRARGALAAPCIAAEPVRVDPGAVPVELQRLTSGVIHVSPPFAYYIIRHPVSLRS